MIQKLLFVSTFAALGALSYGWYYNNTRIVLEHERVMLAQQEMVDRFVNKGPRFTAYDGYELCEQVRILARSSVGFQQSGLQSPDCEKYIKQYETIDSKTKK